MPDPAELAVALQGGGDVAGGTDQPGGRRPGGPVPARRRVEAGVEDLAPRGEVEEPPLSHRPPVACPGGSVGGGQGGDLLLGGLPRLLGGVTYQRGDPQSVLQGLVPASHFPAQRPQTLDASGDSVEWLAPEELDVRLGRRHPFGGRGGAAEVERGVCPPAGRVRTGRDRGAGDLEELAAVRDVLLGPQAAQEVQELPCPRVPPGRFDRGVAVGAEVVRSADDVEQGPAAAELIEGGGRPRELGGLPVAGTHRDQGLERRGARGERRGHREGVRAPPAGAEQRAAPAVCLRGVCEGGRVLDGPPAGCRVVTPVPRLDGVGDVPEELRTHRVFRSLAAPGPERGRPGRRWGREGGRAGRDRRTSPGPHEGRRCRAGSAGGQDGAVRRDRAARGSTAPGPYRSAERDQRSGSGGRGGRSGVKVNTRCRQRGGGGDSAR